MKHLSLSASILMLCCTPVTSRNSCISPQTFQLLACKA